MKHTDRIVRAIAAVVLVLALVFTGTARAQDRSPQSNFVYMPVISMPGSAVTVSKAEPVTPPAALPFFNGHYYQLAELTGKAFWQYANDAASAAVLPGCQSAHLVTITSQEEQDALYSFYMDDLQGKWYGGYQDEGEPYADSGWNWVTGEVWDYTNWYYWEPNDADGPGSEQFLAGSWDGMWNDEGSAQNINGYVVEFELCDESVSTDLPSFNNHYYQLVSASTWPAANAAASAAGGQGCEYTHLVTITSQEEQEALYRFFGDNLDGKWFGGYQDEGELVADAGWNWVTGEVWDYTNWFIGEPDDGYNPGSEQYLAGYYGSTWSDSAGYWMSGYVIEYERCGPPGKETFVTGAGSINVASFTGLPYYNGSYYQIVGSWEIANAAANAAVLPGCQSAHLVTITSQEEQDALWGFFTSELHDKWIGGFQNKDELVADAGWQWVTGEPWDYTHWAYWEPNDADGPGSEQFLTVSWEGYWNDESPSPGWVNGYVIEYESCGASVSTDLPSFNGHYYQLVESYGIPWPDASAAASSASIEACQDAHLVAITSQGEQDALLAFFGRGLLGQWYGGYQDEGELNAEAGWHWVTGEPWDYTNWDYGEPNDGYEPGSEQYLASAMWYPGAWGDSALEKGYVIEYEQCEPGSRATFSFVARFKKGAVQPSGSAEFQFKAGDIKFKSTGYEWLSISGGSAILQGTGTNHGAGAYRFMIWAGDGTGAGGADTFWIKIWEEDESGLQTVLFDNTGHQPITGSIVVHSK